MKGTSWFVAFLLAIAMLVPATAANATDWLYHHPDGYWVSCPSGWTCQFDYSGFGGVDGQWAQDNATLGSWANKAESWVNWGESGRAVCYYTSTYTNGLPLRVNQYGADSYDSTMRNNAESLDWTYADC